MSRFEQDTIKRQIRQLGDTIAAIVARMRDDQDYTSGLEAIREATDKGFGPDRSLLDRLDPKSAVMLLRDAESSRVYAQVCAAEAEVFGKLGCSEQAAELKTRAALVESAMRNLRGSG
jgi:hypothetical protein